MFKELKHLLKHSFIYGLSNILSKAVGFFMIPVYTRFIPPEDYGLLEVLDVSVNILGMFVGMGITSAMARFYYLYETPDDRREIVSSALFFLGVLVFLVAGVGWSLSELISRLLFGTSSYAFYVKIILVTLAFNMILEIPLALIQAMEKSAFFSLISIARLLTALSLNIILVVFMRKGVLGILYSGIITATMFSVGLGIGTFMKMGISLNLSKLWQMIRFGAPLFLHRIGMFVLNWGDRYVLNVFAGLQQVGIYALGYKFGFMISILIGQPFFMIWSVRCYSLIGEKDGEKTYGNVFFLYFMVLMFFWLFLSIFAREIVVLVADKRYQAAYLVIPPVSLGYVLRSCADFFNGILYIEKKTSRLGLITLCVAFYCMINYFLLIPRFHSIGAGIATLSTFLFMAVLTWFSAERVRHIDYHLEKCLIGLSLAVTLWCGGVLSSFFLNGYFLIGFKILFWLAFPLLSFWLLLAKSERQVVLKWLPITINPRRA